jgi:hypothetical protein
MSPSPERHAPADRINGYTLSSPIDLKVLLLPAICRVPAGEFPGIVMKQQRPNGPEGQPPSTVARLIVSP